MGFQCERPLCKWQTNTSSSQQEHGTHPPSNTSRAKMVITAKSKSCDMLSWSKDLDETKTFDCHDASAVCYGYQDTRTREVLGTDEIFNEATVRFVNWCW
jgi:hypothetical protein